MNRIKPFRLLLALVLPLTLAALLRAEPVPATPAPVWQLKNVDGTVVSSASLKGKVVVVDFWATWCGPCRVEIPGYIALQKKYGKDGLVIIGMACDSDKNALAKVKAFSVSNAMNYEVILADEEIQAAFGGMDAIPTTFIIDRAGNIRERKVGAEPTAVYEQTILKYLK